MLSDSSPRQVAIANSQESRSEGVPKRMAVWQWRGQAIRYQQFGSAGAPVLLIHGFGASSDHWQQNSPVLAEQQRVFAIDLLGFGGSAKPQPSQDLPYRFETWSAQVRDFIREVIGEPADLVGNSIGCVVALQAAVDEPALVRSLALLDCSLRLLHERYLAQSAWPRRFGVPIFQQLLAWKPFGGFFFQRLAQPRSLRRILQQAYADKTAVTDELIELLLAPARDPGAVDVFLAFVTYSQGPLPQDLLPLVTCPTLILWGEADPWEPIAQGRELANYPAVREFIALPGVGHCPMDEAPDQVNPILQRWLQTTANPTPAIP